MMTKQTEDFHGVYPPLVLPLNEAREIDYDSLGNQVEFLIKSGVDGVWVNGTSGDFFHLSPSERVDIMRACQDVSNGRIQVIAHVGDTSTRLARKHCEAAINNGAEVVSACFPYYVEFTEEELKYHFREIKKVAGDKPLFLYQLPQITKVKLSVRGALELASEGTICGIKESSGNCAYFRNLCDLAKAENSPLRIFMGVGGLVDLGMFFGGHGFMAAIANLVPSLVTQLYKSYQENDMTEALRLQQEINQAVRSTGLAPRDPLYWAPTVALYKYILKEVGVIQSDAIFEPVAPLTEQEKERLRRSAIPLIEKAMR